MLGMTGMTAVFRQLCLLLSRCWPVQGTRGVPSRCSNGMMGWVRCDGSPLLASACWKSKAIWTVLAIEPFSAEDYHKLHQKLDRRCCRSLFVVCCWAVPEGTDCLFDRGVPSCAVVVSSCAAVVVQYITVLLVDLYAWMSCSILEQLIHALYCSVEIS
jgi:hypothetical protein